MLSTASSSKQVAVNTSRETGKEPGPTGSGWGVVLRRPSEPSKPTDRQAAPGPTHPRLSHWWKTLHPSVKFSASPDSYASSPHTAEHMSSVGF